MCERYLGPDHPLPEYRQALAFDSWHQFVEPGQVAYMNPPYTPTGTLNAFLERAVATAAAGVPVVGLVPASVGTRWWNRWVAGQASTIEILEGRLRFAGPHSSGGAAPWASALVVWGE